MFWYKVGIILLVNYPVVYRDISPGIILVKGLLWYILQESDGDFYVDNIIVNIDMWYCYMATGLLWPFWNGKVDPFYGYRMPISLLPFYNRRKRSFVWENEMVPSQPNRA